MENIDDISTQFIAASVIYTLAQIIVFIACLILIIKQRTIANWILLLGCVLTILFYFGGLVNSAMAGREGTEPLYKLKS